MSKRKCKVPIQHHSQVLLTGSKLETPITAPNIATSTTPPAAILSRKFWSEGEKSYPAAWAASGTTMHDAAAAALRPFTAFSFKDASMLSFCGFASDDFFTTLLFKKASEGRGFDVDLFLAAELSGRTIEIEREAIFWCRFDYSWNFWQRLELWTLDTGWNQICGGKFRFCDDVAGVVPGIGDRVIWDWSLG